MNCLARRQGFGRCVSPANGIDSKSGTDSPVLLSLESLRHLRRANLDGTIRGEAADLEARWHRYLVAPFHYEWLENDIRRADFFLLRRRVTFSVFSVVWPRFDVFREAQEKGVEPDGSYRGFKIREAAFPFGYFKLHAKRRIQV